MKEAQNLNMLNVYSNILGKILNDDEMDQICLTILNKLKECKLDFLNKMVRSRIANSISGKICISLNKKMELGPNVIDLMKFMLEKDLIDIVYLTFFIEVVEAYEAKIKKELLKEANKRIQNLPEMKPPQSINETKRESQKLQNALNENLNRLLNINDKAEKYTKKNFGYSLLDLEGNFIWADKNTMQRLDFGEFDLNHKPDKKETWSRQKEKDLGTKNVNLFDMMIPASKKYLQKKFSEELFKDEKSIGSSICFSFVIYSKASMENCIKHFKKINSPNINNIKLNPKNTQHLEIFTKYLKAVSSRASLVMLSFKRSDIQGLMTSKNCKMVISHDNMEGLINGENLNEKFEKDGEIYQLFVFLETRLAGTVPNFNYSRMIDDPKIVKFKEHVKYSLKKHSKKKRKKNEDPNLNKKNTQEKIDSLTKKINKKSKNEKSNPKSKSKSKSKTPKEVKKKSKVNKSRIFQPNNKNEDLEIIPNMKFRNMDFKNQVPLNKEAYTDVNFFDPVNRSQEMKQNSGFNVPKIVNHGNYNLGLASRPLNKLSSQNPGNMHLKTLGYKIDHHRPLNNPSPEFSRCYNIPDPSQDTPVVRIINYNYHFKNSISININLKIWNFRQEQSNQHRDGQISSRMLAKRTGRQFAEQEKETSQDSKTSKGSKRVKNLN